MTRAAMQRAEQQPRLRRTGDVPRVEAGQRLARSGLVHVPVDGIVRPQVRAVTVPINHAGEVGVLHGVVGLVGIFFAREDHGRRAVAAAPRTAGAVAAIGDVPVECASRGSTSAGQSSTGGVNGAVRQ